MCGLAGFWCPSAGWTRERLQAVGGAMADRVRHRGPDDAGVWVDEAAGVSLAHRRLSIVDLSPLGHQPMVSADGRFVLVFNGEIYNFPELREELRGRGHAFRSHSDTEVILAAITAWGVPAALPRFVGMFAIAVWDRQERELVLARDRLGEKPLYYGRLPGGALAFASELKALRAHPAWTGEVDRDALVLLLRHNYVPDPYSIHRGVRKLLPGTYLRLADPSAEVEPIPYWSLARIAAEATGHPFAGSEREAEDELERLLRRSVAGQMVADVPLGAFLSGGVDSSTVVALMQAQSDRPVKTFTIGFHEGGYDEAADARAVARHLGTEHTELYVSSADALAVIPRLPEMYDEPFADSSQIPTYLVSRLAREQVTVALSGDGGDELFAGYNRYHLADAVWWRVGWAPASARRLASRFLDALSASDATSRLGKIADALATRDADELNRRMTTNWWRERAPVLAGEVPPTPLSDARHLPALDGFIPRMMLLDGLTYLPGDILTKVDRAAMAVGLETRVPFLDHRVVEFAWSLPLAMRTRGGRGKHLLRRVLFRHVPEALVERPKMGFGIPVSAWLRGPLRDWADALLDERRLREEGFFDPAPIRARWEAHRTGRADWQWVLWGVLMFQAWLEHAHRESSTSVGCA